MRNFQDFQLIDGIIGDYEWIDNGSKFTRFYLHRAYWLSITDLDNYITDHNMVSQIYKWKWIKIIWDKWIDAIYIDQTNTKDIYKFKIHFVTNGYSKFIPEIEEDLQLFINSQRHIDYEFILLPDLVDFISDDWEKFDWKFRWISKNFFEKTWPWVRTFICEISWKDLLRLALGDDKIRLTPDASFEDMSKFDVQEKIFDSNVRHYLKQRWEINKSIKKTALDENESPFFFYYNNGITILCDLYDYDSGPSPLVEVKWIQIVNGSQTIHSLKEAFDEKPTCLDDITILARVYETKKDLLYWNIAKYTNSQNAINSRDLRTNDEIHKKIKEYLKVHNINYIIKRWEQKDSVMNNIEIDTLWQILLTWNLELPWDAKNKKSIIFGDKYLEVFNDQINLEKLLEYISHFNYIEEKKILNRSEDLFLSHASWYILFFMKKFKEIYPKSKREVLYSKSFNFIKTSIIPLEKTKLWDQYSDAILFKGTKPKEYLSEVK